MERLTKRVDGIAVLESWAIDKDPFSIIQRLCNRLAAYEDTGLEPEDIKKHEAAYNECLTRTYGPFKQKISQWLQAEKEGRMVVLPCKVGDRVWVTRAYGKPFDAPREGHVRKFVVHDDELVFLEALIWMDLGEGKNEYGYRQKQEEGAV